MASSWAAVPNRWRVVMNAWIFGLWRAASTGGGRALSRAAQLVLPLHRVGSAQRASGGWPVWTAQLILPCPQVGATQQIGDGWPVRAAQFVLPFLPVGAAERIPSLPGRLRPICATCHLDLLH